MGFVSAGWQMGSQGYVGLYHSYFKVSAFQRRFPWEILVVPKRTEFCGVNVGGLHSAAGDSVDTVAVGCDFFAFFFGGAFLG